MNSSPSWNDIYAAGTANAAPKSDVLSSIAFRNLVKGSAAPVGSSVPKSTYKTPKYSGGSSQPEENGFEKFVHTPIIKGIIDALSVGAYSTANAADDVLSGVDKVSKGDLGGLLDIAAAPITGVGKGLSAAAGNNNDAKLWNDVIKHGQKDLGLDTENDAAKWTQGIGGFIGDVALDPTTYLSLGGSALAKGAVRGFVEGGKGAARKAATGARTAAEGGGALVGRAAEINNAADSAGIVNRFKEAGVQAKGDYKDWMKDNGGKIATMSIPFKGSKNPKDAAGIESQSLADGTAKGLEDLIPPEPAMAAPKSQLALEQLPFKAGTDGVEAPSRFISEGAKTPEVVAEEKNIVDGLTEASKSDVPIVDDAIKVPKAASKEEVLADVQHENMQHIIDNVPFTKPTYGGNLLKAVNDAHEGAKPTHMEDAVPVKAAPSVDTGKPDHKGTMAALKASPQALFKMGPKSLSKNEMVQRYVAASKSPNPGQALNAFWNSLPDTVKQTVKEAPKVEEGAVAAAKEIPGTPVDWNDKEFSKIHPDHREMSIDELKAHRSPASDIRSMEQYIEHHASKDEIATLTEKLGLPKFADKKEIKTALAKQLKTYHARVKEKISATKVEAKAAKATPKTGREAVGTPNQMTAQLLDKVSVNQTILRRANRAIDSHARLREPLPGGVDNSAIDVRDVEAAAEKAMNAGLSVQGGKGRDLKFPGNVATDTVDPQTGTAIIQDKWGTNSMLAMHGSLTKSVRSIADSYRIKTGKQMPSYAMETVYRRAIDSAMSNIRAMGVAPYLDLGRGAHNYGVNLGLDDLASLFPKDMETHFFAGPMKGMQPQAFATGVEALIRGNLQGKTEEQLVKDIMDAFTGAEGIYKGKFKDAEGIWRGQNMDSTMRDIKGIDENGKVGRFGVEAAIEARVKGNKNTPGVPRAQARKEYHEMLSSLATKWAKDKNLYQNLNNRMILNAKEHAVEMGTMVDRVSDDTLRIIQQAAAQPISSGDYITMMKKAYEAGKKSLGEADETKYLLWEKAAQDIRDSLLKPGEQRAIKVAEPVIKAADEAPSPKTEESIAVANSKPVDSTVDEAKTVKQDIVEADPVLHEGATPETIESLYDVHSGAVSIDTMRRIHPVSSFFNTKFGLDASGMHSAIGSGLHTQVRMQSVFHGGVMNYLAKNPEKLMDDWKTIQNEGLSHVGSVEAFVPSTDSAKQLYEAINSVFAVSKDNIITRNGLGARHWNAVAESKGLKLTMDETKTMAENSREWMKHEGLDSAEKVLEFLSKSHAVSVNLANDIAIASNFARTFGSAVPKEGYARLAWSKKGITRNKATAAAEKSHGFYDLLPKSVYYSKEASRDIANIHRVLNEARSVKSEGPLGSFMNNVFNPITNLMKASQTIVRPGHWVNNTLGDIMRNHIAGVSSLTPYRHTLAMMKANGREMKAFGENPLEAYKWHKATTDGNFEVHGRGNGVVVHIGGKPQKISYESMFRMLQDGPVMPKHHGGGVAEDFMTAANPETLNRFGKSLDNFQNKVLDNDHFSLNNLAATRDNFSRITLALDHAMKGKFKDIHELKASMEEQVLKWVPTSTDFTARETKYVRPAFMYYTWLRGITPRIVDTLMNKPGVALGPSKALYNVAVANGIDPVSLGNPFPPDAQMPSYYYNNVIGPLMQGEGHSLWGINIANPVTDVMDQLGSGMTLGGMTDGSNGASIGKTLLGAASPFAKIPIDLATQQSNGVPIKDPNQYLQDALTGSYGGLISKSTGKLWNGQGRTDTANGAAHGVDQSDVAALQIANFLSGLKITDYNSPAAQRSYVGEQKQKLSDKKADYRRNL